MPARRQLEEVLRRAIGNGWPRESGRAGRREGPGRGRGRGRRAHLRRVGTGAEGKGESPFSRSWEQMAVALRAAPAAIRPLAPATAEERYYEGFPDGGDGVLVDVRLVGGCRCGTLPLPSGV